MITPPRNQVYYHPALERKDLELSLPLRDSVYQQDLCRFNHLSRAVKNIKRSLAVSRFQLFHIKIYRHKRHHICKAPIDDRFLQFFHFEE